LRLPGPSGSEPVPFFNGLIAAWGELGPAPTRGHERSRISRYAARNEVTTRLTVFGRQAEAGFRTGRETGIDMAANPVTATAVRARTQHEVNSTARSGDGDARASTAGVIVRRPAEVAPVASCEVCGQAARVHVLEGYVGGQPRTRRFCLPCADEAPLRAPGGDLARPRPGLAVMLVLAGVTCAVLGLFGDFLIPQGHAGFGWRQTTGTVLGALVVFVGVLLRADVVALAGTYLLTAALLADWFGLTHGAGIGWKQQSLLGVGIGCVALALLGRYAIGASRRPGSDRHGRVTPMAAAPAARLATGGLE